MLLLRWVVIIATSYLVLFSADAPRSPLVGALLVEFVFSNVALHLVRGGWILDRRVLSTIVVADSIVCSAALLLTPGVEQHLMVVYFFVILLAAVGGSFRGSVGAAVVTSLVYMAFLVRLHGGGHLTDPGALLQVPFIFCAAIFYGYLSEEARRERARADVAEISERAKSELLATLTHDVRNSLGAIRGFAELLLEGLPEGSPPRTVRVVQRIQAVALESVQMITNLLDAGRFEAGRLRADLDPLDAAALLARIAARYEAQAALGQVHLDLALPEALPPVAGDELQLDRVFSNVLSNALKFTPPGGRVSVSAAADAAGVTVEVRDTGPGVAPEDRERIFEMYRQTERGTKGGGAGLGLYVARTLVDAHGGTIEVGDAEGGGAVFRVRLRRAAGPGPGRAGVSDPAGS